MRIEWKSCCYIIGSMFCTISTVHNHSYRLKSCILKKNIIHNCVNNHDHLFWQNGKFQPLTKLKLLILLAKNLAQSITEYVAMHAKFGGKIATVGTHITSCLQFFCLCRGLDPHAKWIITCVQMQGLPFMNYLIYLYLVLSFLTPKDIKFSAKNYSGVSLEWTALIIIISHKSSIINRKHGIWKMSACSFYWLLHTDSVISCMHKMEVGMGKW